MAVGNYESPDRRRFYSRSPKKEMLPFQAAEGLAFGANQDVFLILDLDDTTFQGNTKKHDRAYRIWANLRGYTGPLPDFSDVLAAGRARTAFEPYLDNAGCLEDRMRGAKVIHQLAPMHPDLPKICADLSERRLRPALSITARPQRLESFSRTELAHATGLDIPVFALPDGIPLSDSGQWKVEQLTTIKQQLKRTNREKPIVIFDDSQSLCRLINDLHDPDILCLRYAAEPDPEKLEANWDTLPAKLREIQQLWLHSRRQNNRFLR